MIALIYASVCLSGIQTNSSGLFVMLTNRERKKNNVTFTRYINFDCKHGKYFAHSQNILFYHLPAMLTL